MKFRSVFIFLLLVAIGSLAWVKYKGINPDDINIEDKIEEAQKDTRYNRKIKIGESELMVQVVSTAEDMNKGLSGRENLEEGNGMLFIYQSPQKVSFWMPDMNFPLDIIFLDNDEVVYIETDVPNPIDCAWVERLPLLSITGR